MEIRKAALSQRPDQVQQRKVKVSLDAFDPFVLLLSCWSRDSVERVVSLHHSAVRLRLTRFDHLIFIVGDEELKAVLEGDKR